MSAVSRRLLSAWQRHLLTGDASALAAALATEVNFLDHCGMAEWSDGRRIRAIRNVGRLIRFLRERGILQDELSLVPVLTEEHLRAFLEYERLRMKLASLTNVLGDVVGVLGAIAPDRDWRVPQAWLRRLFALAAVEPRAAPPLVHAATLQRVGMQLLYESLDANRSVLKPLQYQLGLQVMLLIACPLRIHNFARLRIGREIRQVGPGWQIELPASQTKTGQPDSHTVPAHLVTYLYRFVDEVRPSLARPNLSCDVLWLSDTGRPIGEQRLRREIAAATEAHCGIRITPHRFRHSSLTSWTLEQPEHAALATALLGHASGRVAEEHYRIGQRQVAQQHLVTAIERRLHRHRGA